MRTIPFAKLRRPADAPGGGRVRTLDLIEATVKLERHLQHHPQVLQHQPDFRLGGVHPGLGQELAYQHVDGGEVPLSLFRFHCHSPLVVHGALGRRNAAFSEPPVEPLETPHSVPSAIWLCGSQRAGVRPSGLHGPLAGLLPALSPARLTARRGCAPGPLCGSPA